MKIYENDTLIFDGAYSRGYLTYSRDFLENHEIKVDFGTTTSFGYYDPKPEEQYPSSNTLYDWATMRLPALRGNLMFAIGILLFAADILITIHNPDFYFDLKYMFLSDVRNPEPSDWYYSSLKIRRMIMSILIILCVIATFAIH